jgi:alcohol dehydrogenase class IV
MGYFLGYFNVCPHILDNCKSLEKKKTAMTGKVLEGNQMENIITIEGLKKTIFGVGAVNQIVSECKSLAASKALLVIDRALSKTKICTSIQDIFRNSPVKYIPYFEVTPEPSPDLADTGAELAKKENADCVIGIGGGSTMDVAKAVAVLCKNDGKILDYVGLNLVKRPGLPTIMVPTTAGTGSEATFTSVFTMKETKTKGGVNSPLLYPHTAILDPGLTLGLPAHITASTGMDALTHAIESFTSLQAHFMSEPLSLKAIEIISANLRGAVFSGSDILFRNLMMKASYLAGMGLAMSGVGAVHALAYPLGAFFDVPHGLANALMLPHVLEYNYSGDIDKFSRVARAMGEETEGNLKRDTALLAVKAVKDLTRDIGIPQTLKDLRIPEDSIHEMAEAAMKVERPLMNNPRPMTVEIAEDIYKKAFKGI